MKNGNFQIVDPCPLAPERMRELEVALSKSNDVLAVYHRASGRKGRLSFFASAMKAYRPGCGAVVDGVEVTAGDMEKIAGIKAMESELLSGFSRMIQKVLLRVAARHGRDPGDLQSDAYEAFCRALVNYSEGAAFSTYLWWCVQRGVSRACDDGGELNVPRNVRTMAARVEESMRECGMTFDEAVEGLSPSRRSKVVASLSRVCSATELGVRESDMAMSKERESPAWVARALARANLRPLEMAVVRGFMESPAGTLGLSEGCREMVNPDTGRPYSRAALSAAWKQAKKKIARAMDEAA
jgi:hypothetical protein